MKNTVKLILIIFFSIIYSQDVDLTGTEWACDSGSLKMLLTFMNESEFIFQGRECGMLYNGKYDIQKVLLSDKKTLFPILQRECDCDWINLQTGSRGY